MKGTTTAISATFAIVFIVSFPYHAPTSKEEAPHGGAAGLLGFHWGGTWVPLGRNPVMARDSHHTHPLTQSYEANAITKG